MMNLDVIDFKAEGAASLFTQSLKETGFAVLQHHPVDAQLIETIYQKWLHFFQGETKNDYQFDPKTHAGFISTELSETAKGSQIKDLKEFFHYYRGHICPPELKEETDLLYVQMQTLAEQLLGWIEHALPDEVRRQLSVPLSEMITDSSDTLLRVIHYPPLIGTLPAGAVRAAAHEDINLLTVLPAATAKGLQVQLKEGDWIDVPCEQGWLIVNIGDMLQECTEGFYRSTSHRVINPSDEYARQPRVSCPLFLHPRGDVVLSDRHTAESYRQERFAELGLVAQKES